MKGPVLIRPDPDKPYIMETDASDFAIGAVLSQEIDNKLHPIAFYSATLTDTERNYAVADKELLAIIKAFKQWRHHLEGAKHKIVVQTDSANLRFFMEAKKLNQRHARWALELSRYNFEIVYRPGRKNGKADALSRRPDYAQGLEKKEQVLLPERLFRNPYDIPTKMVTLEDSELSQDIKQMYGKPEFQKQLNQVTNLHCNEATGYYHQGQDKQIWVPDDHSLYTEITRINHDSKMAGHPGPEKTIELVKRNFY